MEKHEHNHEQEVEKHCCCNHEHEHEESHCGCEHEHHEHDHQHDDGLHCCCGHDHEEDEDRGEAIKKIVIAFILFAVGLVLEHTSFTENFGVKSEYPAALFYFVAYIKVGLDVLRGAISNIRKGNVFGEQFLMAVASLGAIFLGEFAEAVAVMLFYQIGEFFQDYAVDKSRDSISALMDIRPDHANVLRNGSVVQAKPEEVQLEEIIEIRPGERVPLDGIVVEGSSYVDTSALTGESVPRSVSADSEILAGFVNNSGLLKVRVTKLYGESAVTRILNLTEKASSVKAKSEKFISRFSKVYTPIVCGAALCVALIPPLFTDYGFSVWVYRALSFLVVSCPCALVISVPLSFFSGIGAASSKGILIKGSNFMENLAKIKTAVFDKTGTLTHGVFKVSSINICSEISEKELLKIAAHAETYSDHPISKSLKEAHAAQADENCCANLNLSDAGEISGHGISVVLDGKKVLIGNPKLMKKENILGFEEKFSEENQAGTTVHVSIKGKYAGNILISDEIKPDSKKAISLLKKLGIKKTVMLTGDSKSTAEKVASEIGIDEVYGQLLPEEKVQKVEALLESGEKLAFVGDGINDSPVLARADVGIAMGALGSDAAIEAADVVLMDDNPIRLCDAVKISRKTVAIVRENIILSLGVKVAIMILEAFGFANLWLAVFGDVGVCFIAILNSMRAMKCAR